MAKLSSSVDDMNKVAVMMMMTMVDGAVKKLEVKKTMSTEARIVELKCGVLAGLSSARVTQSGGGG